MLTPEAAQQLTQKVLDAMMDSGTYEMRRDAEIDLAALQSYSYRQGYATAPSDVAPSITPTVYDPNACVDGSVFHDLCEHPKE